MSIKEYKLGEIIYFSTGIDPTDDEKVKNGYPWIKLGNTNNYYIDYSSAEKIITNRKERLKNGDLILCWSCSIGQSWIISKECYFSTAFYKCNILDREIITNKFLHYIFVKNKEKISKLAVGSVLKKANMNILSNFIIKIPDKSAQQSIIDIIEPFEKYSSKIEKKIDKLIKIGDLLINSNNEYKIKIKEISNVNIGATPSTKNNSFWNGDFPWINSGILTNKIVQLNHTNLLTKDGIKSKNLKLANKNSILLSIIEPTIKKISLCGYNTFYNQSICNLQSKNSLYNGWLFFEIRKQILELSKLATGTAQQSINKTDIEEFLIDNPCINVTIFNNICSCLIIFEKQKYLIEKIKKLLIEKLIL